MSNIEPFKNLWAAVIERAFGDLRLENSPVENEERYYYSAVRWFNDTENHEIGSFLWICELLEIDPGKIREKINVRVVHGHVKLSQKWSSEIEPLGN